MKRPTIEERAEKRFPFSADSTAKERSSILAMRKAWIKVEQVQAEKRKKEKQKADKKALALGKAVIKSNKNIAIDELLDLAKDGKVVAKKIIFHDEETGEPVYNTDMENDFRDWSLPEKKEGMDEQDMIDFLQANFGESGIAFEDKHK